MDLKNKKKNTRGDPDGGVSKIHYTAVDSVLYTSREPPEERQHENTDPG
jgi:hypothetical protein